MRRRIHALTRNWVALAAVVLIPLGTATAVPSVATAAPAGPATLPHVAGGYVGGGARLAAKVTTGGYGIRSLPDSVDLRSYAPPVGDQGQVGSCVAWTIAHGIMGYYAKRHGGVGAPYAPLFLYLRNVAPGGAPTAGLYPDSVLANAQAAGVDTQADYWQGTTDWRTPPTAAQIANATNYRLTGWNRLFAGGNQGAPAQTVIQQALAAGSPVALSFPVYRDFMYLSGPTLYNTLSGTSLGGHMVTAFGYDTQGVWLRNSWGTGWGDRGDVKVSWAFITKVVNSAYTVTGIQTPAAPAPAPAPAVAALSVGRGLAGTTVIISGTDLAGATAVRFGTQAATFTATASGTTTRLVATAPAHPAGAVDVTVTTPAGTSVTGPAARFTYLPPAPAVTGLDPATVSTAGGATVTVIGTDLAGVKTVRIGGVVVPARAVTATSLTVVVPVRPAGPADVTVTGPSGSSAAGSAARLTYVVPTAPVVRALAPSTRPKNASTPVVVTGANFGSATRVSVGGRVVRFVRLSDASLRLDMGPRVAGVVAVQVTGPGGVSAVTAAASYTYQAPPVPVIAGLSSTTGRANVATALVVTGANFGGATRVTIGGVPVGFSQVSATELRFTAPPRAAGRALITVTTPSGTSTPATFTYVAPAALRKSTA